MDFSSLQNLSDSDRETLQKVSLAIRKERAAARAQKSKLENVIQSYQIRIAAFTKERKTKLSTQTSEEADSLLESKISAARKEVQSQNDEFISKLRAELGDVHKKLQESMAETVSYQRNENVVKKKAVEDAQTISQLREELEQLRESKQKIESESVQNHARNLELLRESQESSSKVMTYEESNTFLKEEVVRLTRELMEARTSMDELKASDEAALKSALGSNADMTDQLAKANVKMQKLTAELSEVERKLIDTQADFDRERADQKAEVENLNKLIKMHSEATKDAEIRLAGYSEVLGTLSKEKKEAEQRRRAESNSILERHAEVLFKDLNEALDTKLMVLEKERQELSKARASEARMATKCQTLLREADTARRDLYEAQQKLATFEEELSTEKGKVLQLERKLRNASTSGAAQSPPGLPFGETTDSGLPSKADVAGWASGMPSYTPSPFRRTLRIGSAEKSFARMAEIRRQHEALLEGIRDRQEDYMELTND